MRQINKLMFATVAAQVLLCCCFGFAQGVPTTVPAPNPNLTAPGPQAHRPPGGQHPQVTNSGMTNAPQPTNMHAPAQGVVSGYIYWDPKSLQYARSIPCKGLTIVINVAKPSTTNQPTFQQFQTLAMYHNFTSMSPVGPAAVCAYSAANVPTGVDLQVVARVDTTIFLGAAPQGAVPPTANDPNSMQIPGGTCNQLPSAVPSASSLRSGFWTCGNNAYNVNFILQPANAANSGKGGGQLTPLSGAASQGGMLSGGNAQRGMLNGGTNPGPQNSLGGSLKGGVNAQQTPAQSTPAGTPGQLLPAKPGGAGGNVQLNPQPYPPKGTSSVGGTNGNKVSLNPQPFPPRSIGSQAVKLSAPHQGQKIVNPKAAAHNAAIIAVLAKQRQAADAEASQMKLSIVPAAIQTQPSTVMSATGNGGMIAPSANAQRVATTANIPPATNSNSSVSRYGKLSSGMIAGLALQCAQNPNMRIATVSGGPKPAIFTPDPQYDFYTITGCSFGNPGPNGKVYIYHQGTFHEDFIIDEWTDNWIKLHLDSSLTAVDDQNNLTLVIQRADGQQTSKSGYQFYAVRATTLLSSIPQASFSLNNFRPDQSVLKTWKPTYTSASSASVIPNLPGLSAEVHWDITTDPNGTVVGGNDDYDFSHLHFSFAVDSAWMEWTDVSCDQSEQFAASNNNWGLSWYGASGLQVRWQGQQCQNKWHTCGGAFQPDCFYSPPESNYGIDVWVIGPRGLDAWTGKPGS